LLCTGARMIRIGTTYAFASGQSKTPHSPLFFFPLLLRTSLGSHACVTKPYSMKHPEPHEIGVVRRLLVEWVFNWRRGVASSRRGVLAAVFQVSTSTGGFSNQLVPGCEPDLQPKTAERERHRFGVKTDEGSPIRVPVSCSPQDLIDTDGHAHRFSKSLARLQHFADELEILEQVFSLFAQGQVF
jgi:hypothetical protein